MTRKTFGELSGLNLKQIKMLENGIFPTKDLTLLARIEEILGITIRKGGDEFSQPMRKMVEVREDNIAENFSRSIAKEVIVNNSSKAVELDEVESAERLIRNIPMEPVRGVGWKAMTRRWSIKRGKENEFKNKRAGKEKEIDLGEVRGDLMSSDDIELL